MSSAGATAGSSCHHCGCAEIDVDPARGNAVCTGCGSVLEQHIIVSEMQFEENAHGGTSAIGQFVGADGKGSRCDIGFNRVGRESREVTLNNAKKKLTWLGQKLRLNQHCVDTSFNFFKMALSGGLTRGRKNDIVTGACLYITCRTEGTPHMLIDFSDALLVDVSELGRTFTALSTALCINIPVMDPCMYVMRFANKLEFGSKTHDVSVTAARLMQRMKRDWIHTGRRPSGLCGAALLLAARLHGFNRSVDEIVRIVRVHHSTVRKRLTEFKNTPSSSLTLDEFMSVDLDEEVDPPSFINSRRKDKEHINQLFSDEKQATAEFQAIQREIERELDDCKHKLKFKWHQDNTAENDSADQIIEQFTMDAVRECAGSDLSGVDLPISTLNPSCSSPSQNHTSSLEESSHIQLPDVITPRRAELGLPVSSAILGMDQNTEHRHSTRRETPDHEAAAGANELCLDGIDDSEIDSYIMSSKEIVFKSKLWMKLNADYLKEQQEKRHRAEEERIRLEKEGRPMKKTRKRRKQVAASGLNFHSAEEAIEKMLHEKKLSAKINYEVLRELSESKKQVEEPIVQTSAEPAAKNKVGAEISSLSGSAAETSADREKPGATDSQTDISSSPRASTSRGSSHLRENTTNSTLPNIDDKAMPTEDGYDDEDDEDCDVEDHSEMMSAAQLLSQHASDEFGCAEQEDYF